MSENNIKDFRQKLFTDLYTNVVPERIPFQDSFSFEFQALTAGYDLMEFEYNLTTEKVEAMLENTMTFAKGDVVGLGSPRDAVGLMLQKNRSNQMSSTGFIQHPEREMLLADEYDEYIKNPHEFAQRVISLRQYGSFSDDPVLTAMNFARYMLAVTETKAKMAVASKNINEKYGLYSAPAGTSGRQPVPFDMLTDMNRGFSKITLDIKRYPEKVLEALEALMPYCIYSGNQSKAHPLGQNGIATHMGPYLRNSEFDKFYWPTFFKLVHIQAKRGQQTSLFCESDWMRYLDHLSELPMGTRMYFEYGNPKNIKDKLGKKMVIGGLYPVTLLKTGTKEQCVDKAKELMDVLAPGGNYYFRFDKSALFKDDVNIENYKAVADYVLGLKYDNAGQTVTDMKKEDTIISYDPNEYPEFKSKYIVDFETFTQDYEFVNDEARGWAKAAFDKYNAKVQSYFS